MKRFGWLLITASWLTASAAQAVTFGEEGTGTAALGTAGTVYATQCICPADGQIDRLLLHVATAAGQGQVAVYASAEPNTPAALLAQSAAQILEPGWNQFAIPTTTVTSGTVYWLAVVLEAGAQISVSDDAYDYKSRSHAMPFGSFANPFPTTSPGHSATRLCLHATESTPTPTPTPSPSPSPGVSPSPTSTPTVIITKTPTVTLTAYVTSPGRVVTYPSPATGAWVYFYYATDGPGTVRIFIYDMLGAAGPVLQDQVSGAGYHRTSWNIRGIAPGVYLYRLVIEKAAGQNDLGWKKIVIVQ